MGLQKYFFNRQQFIKDYDMLKSSRKMAEKYGCNKSIILKYARLIDYHCDYGHKLTPEKKQYIIDMYYQKTNTELAKELGLTRGEVTKTWRDFKLKDKQRRIFNLNENFFEKINTKEKAYFLGLLAADGNVQYHKNKATTIKITLQSEDEEILLKFRDALETSKPFQKQVKKNKKGEKRKYLSLEISSNIMGVHLAQYGIIPQKTWIYEPKNIPSSFLNHFFRGYFDGDGSWSIHSDKMRPCDFKINITGFIHNLKKMQDLLQKQGISSKVYQDKRKYSSQGGDFGFLTGSNIEQNKQLADFIYQDNEGICFNRKLIVYNQFLNAYKNKRKKPKNAVSFEVNEIERDNKREKKLED